MMQVFQLLWILSVVSISRAQNALSLLEERVEDEKTTSSRIQNPFLSTTLSTTITYSESSPTYLDFNRARKSAFSETLAAFLTKVFKDQQVYDVNILSVNLFDDHLLNKDGQYAETTTRQHNNVSRTEKDIGDDEDGNGRNSLSFSTVVSAEYTEEAEIDSIATDSFQQMLVHVCEKFQDHLIKFMKDTGDPYFMDVESVVLADFERMPDVVSSLESVDGVGENSKVFGMSEETVNTASIIAIVLGGAIFVVLALATVKYYRKEKQLIAARWRSKELASLNGAAQSSIASPGGRPGSHTGNAISLDDYSFNPLGASPGAVASINRYSGSVPPYSDFRDDPIHNHPSMNDEEIAFSSVWPESAPPAGSPTTLFPETTTAAPPPSKLSYSEELQRLPKQHVFAPPGKIGVAIDVYNGQPTVHKVRKGSPLEKMLQPNDVILSIDDEDTSCLSAADVTQLMVKRMDRVRKITFVRRG